jgi:hypothetical protein
MSKLMEIEKSVEIDSTITPDVVLIGGNFFDTDGVVVSVGKKIAIDPIRDRVCIATSYGVADADGQTWIKAFSMTNGVKVLESTCAGSWALPMSCRNLMSEFPIDDPVSVKPCGKIVATGIYNEDELKEAVEKALKLIG